MGARLGVFLHGAKRRSCDFDFACCTVFQHHTNRAEVWKKATLGFIVGVAYVVANDRALACDCTFSCHVRVLGKILGIVQKGSKRLT